MAVGVASARMARKTRETGEQPRRKPALLEREAVLAYLLMAPGALLLILFMGYPFFLGIWLSLTDKLVGFSDYSYIGLENFRWLWSDTIFRQAITNTFIYGFVTVPFKLLLGLGLALLLNEQFRFSRFARA